MRLSPLVLLLGAAGLVACHGGSDPAQSVTLTAAPSVDCAAAASHVERVVCAANGFKASLTPAQQAAVQYDFGDAVAKTRWSNLPAAVHARSGVKLGDMSPTARANALNLVATVLTAQGVADVRGVIEADDYLNAHGGNSNYGSAHYYFALYGTPSPTGLFMVQWSGHHVAFNVTYVHGEGFATPNHLGAEPRFAFTQDGNTYAPLADELTAFASLFDSLSAAQLQAAHVPGLFSDVLLGPVEYGTGAYTKVVFPTGAERTGVLVSDLDAAQQALVLAAIEKWVRDFDPAIADGLVRDYTTPVALADTYLSWAGSTAAPDVAVPGTYFRIDGPKLWIEVACQPAFILKEQTHLHTMFRDKTRDYGALL